MCTVPGCGHYISDKVIGTYTLCVMHINVLDIQSMHACLSVPIAITGNA